MGHTEILKVTNLTKTFYKGKDLFTAVNGISFTMQRGECLGLVGESGCGKSTTVKMLTRLLKPESGCIELDAEDVLSLKGRELKHFYSKVQMVFQTASESFDPRRTLGDGIMEGLRNQGKSKAEARKRMLELLKDVELEPEYATRLPHEVSGGQCQRAAIARALAVNPELVICDEATSALDVTVQAQIVELLKRLQRERGLSMLLISHDLALVQRMCDRVLVMYEGKILEEGTPDQIIRDPKEAYTKLLVESVL